MAGWQICGNQRRAPSTHESPLDLLSFDAAGISFATIFGHLESSPPVIVIVAIINPTPEACRPLRTPAV
ncbi:MAG: hypothetical protein IPI44_07865 [Sulfuritalea sp.]|nr:hypothetical protein [Sulfuritalea sp.]MBK8120401.1 hypothetical protein [Sulfuritalea sp.]